MSRGIAVAVVVGLAIAIVLLWPGSTDDGPPVAVHVSTTVATTTSSSVPVSSVPETSSTETTSPDSHVVDTVAEAETILRELWFGWFEGIYNQDEDRIREVVASQQFLQAGVESFGMTFVAEPNTEGIGLDIEILRADSECLATFGALNVEQFRGEGAETESVQVLRWTGEEWALLSSWRFRDDLWEEDCESQLQPLR